MKNLTVCNYLNSSTTVHSCHSNSSEGSTVY